MATSQMRGLVNSRISTLPSGSIPSDLYVREIPDFISEVKSYDNVMLTLVKSGGERKTLPWLYGEGDLAPTTDTVGSNYTSGATSLVVADSDKFQINDMLRIGSEVMIVTAINAGTDTLTVVPGWGSTNSANHSSGDKILIMGPATPEGSAAVDSPVSFGTVYETGPQIMEMTWKLTHRARVITDWEVKSDRFRNEQRKKMKEIANDLNTMLLNGIYNAGDGATTGGTQSTMMGLREATTVNVTDLSGAPLTLDDLMVALQAVVEDVGQANVGKTIMGGYFAKQIFNSWYQGTRRASLDDTEMKLQWDSVETDFGRFKFVINKDCDKDELFVWNPEDAKLCTVPGGKWETGAYATNGWFDQGFVRGDYGALFFAPRRRLRLKGFSTTKADYPLLNIAA